MFRIGQRVVCVRTFSSDGINVKDGSIVKENSSDPKLNEVVSVSDRKAYGNRDLIRLEEYPNNGYGGKKWYPVEAFKPLCDNYAEGVLSEIKKSTLDETLELLEQIKTKETVK